MKELVMSAVMEIGKVMESKSTYNCMVVKMMGMLELQVMSMMESKLKLVVKMMGLVQLKTMQTVYVRIALALLFACCSTSSTSSALSLASLWSAQNALTVTIGLSSKLLSEAGYILCFPLFSC